MSGPERESPREPERKFKGVWICASLWDRPDLTARGFLIRLGFNGREIRRCTHPDIASDSLATKTLIGKYNAVYSPHLFVRSDLTPGLKVNSPICDTEIPSKDTNIEKKTKSASRATVKRKVRHASRKESSSSFSLALPVGEGEGKGEGVTNETAQQPITPSPELVAALEADAKDQPPTDIPSPAPESSASSATFSLVTTSRPGDDASDLEVALYCAEKYGYRLNTRGGGKTDLARKLDDYLHRLGVAYVVEKIEVADHPKYAATQRESFFAALKGDWQLPVSTAPAKSDIGHGWATLPPETQNPPGNDERSRVAAGLAAWRRSEQRGATP